MGEVKANVKANASHNYLEKAPLWMRELHAWKSNPHRVMQVTLAQRVDNALSLFHDRELPCGFEALRALCSERVSA